MLQRAVLRRAPGRVRVTAGEPAHAHRPARRVRGRDRRPRRRRRLRGLREPPRDARRGPRRAPADRRPLQGPAARRRAGRRVGARARARRRARRPGRAPGGRGARRADRRPARARRRPEPAGDRRVPRRDGARCTAAPGPSTPTPRASSALRELNRTTALVFLPSHRSYSDPLVLADVLDAADFPRNHVLGGNNLAFWPIGPLGKRAGLIFIRRSFGDDPVYKLAVREYFGHLVAKRFNLEWYIEGGRTRTGKLRPPRYGLLHYLVRALEDGQGEDVTLVPVSITYDQLQEVAAMAAEQGGGDEVGRGPGLAGRLRPRPAAQRRHGARALRRAAVAAPGARGRRRGQRAAREGRVPDLRRDQPRLAGDGDLAGDLRAAERPRPRADARAGARRSSRRCSTTSTRARSRGRPPTCAMRPRSSSDAGDARRGRRRERLRGRRRAGLVDRARAPPRRGLLPQRHAAPRRQPGDHRARRARPRRRSRRRATPPMRRGRRRCATATC